ncbi:MAG: hypothetical protein MW689_001649 [Thermodesulfobacteria bacterium]|nr:hypothetical protein [Thermodesulfobacteriota bacterium]
MLGSTISVYPNRREFLAKYLKMPNVLQKIHIPNADIPLLIASQGDTHFPRCHPEIRQTFQLWYRLLLWEQMWKGHLWHYQLLMLNREELLELGLIVETNVVSVQNNQIELEVIGREANTLRGYEYCTVIPYGTVFCGLKLDARLVSTRNNNIVLQLSGILPTISEEAILLLSPDIPAPIMKEPPIFLEQQIQYQLYLD